MNLLGRCAALVLTVTFTGVAQDSRFSTNGADYHSASSMQREGAKLLTQAKAGSGSATLSMEKYPGHFMNLTVRTKSGGGELHANWSDIFVALDGEATVITGGTLVDRQNGAGGESRGTKVEGGSAYVMKKGDVIHISAGVPHQTMVAPGKAFTYFVVKARSQSPSS